MARRVVLGKAGSDYGLFVSKSGTDVINDSGVLTSGENLQFDSRVGAGNLQLKFHGQGQLGIPNYAENYSSLPNLAGSNTFGTVTHNLGYKPFVIVQWCLTSDVSGGVATKMFPAFHADFRVEYEDSDYGQRVQTFRRDVGAGVWFEVTNTQLKIYNNMVGTWAEETYDNAITSQEYSAGKGISYAFLIFDVEGVDTTI